MSFYILVYLLASIFSFCYSKSKDKNATIVFFCLTFLTLFLPLALRYEIGTDYVNYERIIETFVRTGSNRSIEIGWLPLLLFIRNYQLDSHLFFVVPAFLSTLIVFICVPKKYLWFCLPPYITIYWIESFSLVRQAFAASMFLFATHHFFRRKYFLFGVFAILSCCFHKSLVVLVVLTPLCLFRWKIFTPLNNMLIVIIFYGITRFVNVAGFIMENIVEKTMYAKYVSSSFNRVPEVNSGLGLYIRLAIFIIPLIISFVPYRKIRPENPRGFTNGITESLREYNLMCLYIYTLIVGHVLAYQIHIFNRIPNIFSIFYLLFSYKLMTSVSPWRKIGMVVFQFLIFILFISSLLNANASLAGGLGIVPYQTIFSR